ncbi:Hsp20/alpha crystallin family protein [Desulfovibrio mangrovi]|uniref:Hsp20/alpha crystallin family protein n=1 Tax=Desulfovibrio mangrovi TaxID=2976983 RepID=UPI002247F074|nr:Hsp20/alpha crystallin family protein [Desulfovibrio mangrovi]UZP68341.1 Hsp20/alpha crystallin family protein [Desulfovibrio mangrovi]
MPNLKIWKSQQLQRLRNDSERLFDRLCSEFGLPSVCQPLMEVDLTIKDLPDEVVVEAQLPGVSPEDISIVIDDTLLTISCREQEVSESGTQTSVMEHRFRLPCKVRSEEVVAELNGALLRITMPKCRKPESRRIPVVLKQKP